MDILVAKDKEVVEPHSVKFDLGKTGKLSAELKCYGRTPQQALKKANELLIYVKQICREHNESQ